MTDYEPDYERELLDIVARAEKVVREARAELQELTKARAHERRAMTLTTGRARRRLERN